MQKLWTICLSLMMGISFVASYPAALVEAPAMKTPDESLEAIKAKAFMDPLDQLGVGVDKFALGRLVVMDHRTTSFHMSNCSYIL